MGPQNLCEDFAIRLPTRLPGSVTCVTEELLGSRTRSCLQLLQLLGQVFDVESLRLYF